MNGYALTLVTDDNGVTHAVQGHLSGGFAYPRDAVCGAHVLPLVIYAAEHDHANWRQALAGTHWNINRAQICSACEASWERVLADYDARVREVRAETDAAHRRIRAGVGTAEDWALTYND